MKQKRRNRLLLLFMAVVLALMVCGMSGCSGSAADDGTYDNWTLTLSGLEEGSQTITVGELKAMDSVTERAEANRSNGDVVKIKATGPLLSTLLEKCNINLDDYNTVRLNARDGYSIAIPPDVLKSSDVILAYYDKGKPLEEKDGPIRAVVVGQRAMYWVRMLESIDFESDAGVQVANKVVMLDTALQQDGVEPVALDTGTEDCMSTSRLISVYADIDDNTVQNVYLAASDGLVKNEKKDNFLGKYLTVNGEQAPTFNAPGLQEGMTVTGLLTVNYGDTAFFSVKQGMECMGLSEHEGHDALPLSGVLRKIGSLSTDVYRFTDASGKVSEYTADELVDPVIWLENGAAVFSAGTEDSFEVTIKNLLTIEAVE